MTFSASGFPPQGVGAWEGKKWNNFSGITKTEGNADPSFPGQKNQDGKKPMKLSSLISWTHNISETLREMRGSHGFRASFCTTPGRTIAIRAMEVAGDVLELCARGYHLCCLQCSKCGLLELCITVAWTRSGLMSWAAPTFWAFLPHFSKRSLLYIWWFWI